MDRHDDPGRLATPDEVQLGTQAADDILAGVGELLADVPPVLLRMIDQDSATLTERAQLMDDAAALCDRIEAVVAKWPELRHVFGNILKRATVS